MSRKKHKKKNPVQQNILKEEETKVEEQPVVEGPVLEEEKEDPIVTESSTEKQITDKKEPVISEKRKENDKKILIILVIVLVLMIIYTIICNDTKNTNKKPEEKPINKTEEIMDLSEEDNSVYPPEDAEIEDVDYSTNWFSVDVMEANSIISKFRFNMSCELDQDTNVDIMHYGVKKKETITCKFNFISDGENQREKANYLFFELNYGDGLRLLEVSNPENNGSVIDNDNNRYKDNGGLRYRFEVTDDVTPENLFIEVNDLIVKSTIGKYYRDNDYTFKSYLEEDTGIYIFYKDDYDIVYTEQKWNLENDRKIHGYGPADYTIVGEYHCKERLCEEVPGMSDGNYKVFKDGKKIIAYNYINGEEKDLSDFIEEYGYNISLVANSKLGGFIIEYGNIDDLVCYQEVEEYSNCRTTAYYSFEKNKLVFKVKPCQLIYGEDGYIINYNVCKKEEKFYDYEGNPLVPTTEVLKRIENTNFYYLVGMVGHYLYNEEGKPLFEGKPVGYYNYTSSINNNLLVVKDNRLIEYNIDEQVVYESERYNDLLLLEDGYLAAIDKNGILKAIDKQENVIHEFGKVGPNDHINDSEWDAGPFSGVQEDKITIYAGHYEYYYDLQTGESHIENYYD